MLDAGISTFITINPTHISDIYFLLHFKVIMLLYLFLYHFILHNSFIKHDYEYSGNKYSFV
jgi:hypothetical protein